MTSPWDPVTAVLTNRDLAHEILRRVRSENGAEAALPAPVRARLASLSPAFADAAARLPVTLDAADPTTWALARHGGERTIRAALAGLVAADGGGPGGGRAATLALARCLSSADLSSLTALTRAPCLHGPWLRDALSGGHVLTTLSLTGYWHRPAALARLPAGVGVAGRLTLTQLPGGGVGAGKGALLPHPRLLAGFPSAPDVMFVGLAGAALAAVPADLARVALEGVPVVVGAGGEEGGGGGGGAISFTLPPTHPRLASLRLGFVAPETGGRRAVRRGGRGGGAPAPPRPAVVEVGPLAGTTAALCLSAPGRTVRLVVAPPPRAVGADGEEEAEVKAAAALRAALVGAGLGRLTVESAGWEVEVVMGGGEGRVVPGDAPGLAGVLAPCAGGGWGWGL